MSNSGAGRFGSFKDLARARGRGPKEPDAEPTDKGWTLESDEGRELTDEELSALPDPETGVHARIARRRGGGGPMITGPPCYRDAESEEIELIHQSDVVDISSVEIAPDGYILGVYTEPDYPEFALLNAQHEMAAPLMAVRNTLRGYRVRPTSITEDGKLAIIRASSDRVPPTLTRYNVSGDSALGAPATWNT